MAYFLGLDLGGTNIKAGVVDDQGRILSRCDTPTSTAGPDQVIMDMAQLADDATKAAHLTLDQIAKIGIGSPGPLNIKEGLVISSPNIPGWTNVPLTQRIEKLTHRPAVLENDANAAAFGEYWVGAGKDPEIQNLIMLTLGTGVGGGIILNGQLIHGSMDQGAEVGHMIIVPDGRPCGCGQRGCLETYASASRTAIRAREELAAGADSKMQARFAEDPRLITAQTVFEAAMAGDSLANQIVDRTACYLAIACVNLCRLLDPQMIVFAGGMALAGDFLLKRVQHHFTQQTWQCAEDHVQLAIAQLGNDAGIIGAASIAWDTVRPGR